MKKRNRTTHADVMSGATKTCIVFDRYGRDRSSPPFMENPAHVLEFSLYGDYPFDEVLNILENDYQFQLDLAENHDCEAVKVSIYIDPRDRITVMKILEVTFAQPDKISWQDWSYPRHLGNRAKPRSRKQNLGRGFSGPVPGEVGDEEMA